MSSFNNFLPNSNNEESSFVTPPKGVGELRETSQSGTLDSQVNVSVDTLALLDPSDLSNSISISSSSSSSDASDFPYKGSDLYNKRFKSWRRARIRKDEHSKKTVVYLDQLLTWHNFDSDSKKIECTQTGNFRYFDSGLFQHFTKLEKLDLSENNLTASLPLDIFKGLNNLTTLRIDNSFMPALSLRTFSYLPSLKYLIISENYQINSKTHETKSLKLSGKLLGVPSLILVNLCNCCLKELDPLHFLEVPSLEVLQVYYNNLSPENIQHLRYTLPNVIIDDDPASTYDNPAYSDDDSV